MTSLRKKIIKSVAIILSVLIVIALAALMLLYFEVPDYLNKNLSEFIAKKSKGKYELTFENVKLNFNPWGFEINKVSFHPTDSIIQILDQSNTNKQFYSFSSPNIRLDGIQVFQLLFHKNLEIGEIRISQPELKIHGKQTGTENKKNNISTILQELKPLVTQSFNFIKIDKIELTDASFDFYNLLGDTRKLSNAENITIGILRFYTDSLLLPDPNRLFDADDIYLRMQKYQNKLADSIHILQAKSITYSLKHSQIEAENIELKPDKSISEKSQYHIRIPHAKMVSKHIAEFYQNKAIPIDSLILTDAKITYWPGQIKSKIKLENIADFDLYELIKNEFSCASIRIFKIENAQLSLFKSLTEKASRQELKSINLKLEDFLLDSVSVKDTSRIFYSKNIDLSATEYELTLDDNNHRIRAGYIDLSTQKRVVQVKNVQLYPIQNNSNAINEKSTIEANCDSIRLDRFNFKKAYHQKRFVFQNINLFNPEVKLIQYESSKEKLTTENPSFVYNLISSYAKGVYAKQVSVLKGKIQLVNQTGLLQTGNIESIISLQLSGFALDEVSASKTDRLFFANHIELNFSDYKMQLVDQLHKMTIDNLSISSKKKQAKLKNLHLSPEAKENIADLLKQYNRSELYEFTIPELSLSNVDFHEAFYNKKLSVDTLSIKTPQIYYENFALLKQLKPKAEFEDLFLLLSNYLDNIQLNKVNIPDGTIKLINHSRNGKTISLNNHFSLALENTLINNDRFGQKKLLFSEYVDFSVRDHVFRLSDNVHVLKVGELGFSSKKRELYVTNAALYPESNNNDLSPVNWNIQLAIPEIKIKGISMESLYFDRKIDAERLIINSPDIKLYQRKKKTEIKDIKDFSLPLPKEIESIAIGQFVLNDGSLKVFSEMGVQPYLLLQSDLKMMAQNMLIQNNIEARKVEFIKGEYLSKLIQFKFTPKNKNQQFSIDELTYSTIDHSILASQLMVKPKSKSVKQNQFELRIPKLSLNGLDIEDAYLKDQFLFESIVLDKPVFQFFNNTKDSARFNPYKINLYPHFESFCDVFASKSIIVNQADISVFKNGEKKTQEKVTFNLANVRIDDKPSLGFIHASDFSFQIPSLKRQNKNYQFTAGETSYSSKNNRFLATDIKITPNLSKEKYQKQARFQSDYFNGKIDSICIEKPNIRQWFDKEELIGKYLSVNGLDLCIYRDKRIPFNESRRTQMLQDLLKSSKYSFSLDSFNLVDANITYIEQPATGKQEGKIRFTNLQARLLPFTNIKNAGGKIPDFVLEATTTIMDSCVAKVKMNYQMSEPDNLFTASGSLNSFNMRILNPILEPLASVSMRSGKVDRFQFNFTADKTIATGSLFFGYNDLRISVLEKKNGNTKEARFMSFLANSLLLRSKNPRGKELLPDEIYFTRDIKRSDLNYWWKSVFSGIRNTLGIKESKPEKEE